MEKNWIEQGFKEAMTEAENIERVFDAPEKEMEENFRRDMGMTSEELLEKAHDAVEVNLPFAVMTMPSHVASFVRVMESDRELIIDLCIRMWSAGYIDAVHEMKKGEEQE